MGAIGNYFFPINPVTKRREFHLIPTRLEVFAGKNSYAPLMEKTMILDQFTSRAAAGSPAPEHILGGVGFGGWVVK